VRGKNAHDARLVAAMLVHGLTHVLTFNGKDFARFGEIAVIPPDGLPSPVSP
jgi:predicted nucleic acid-binding protein